MDNECLVIDRVIYGDDDSVILYRLNNGNIVNVDEAVDYIRQGRIKGVVIATDENGRQYIRPSGQGYNGIE